MDLNPAPFRGDAGIPHVSEDFFKACFLGANLALAFLSLPGRVIGSEIRPRKFNADYIMACTDEAARRREALKGKKPRHLIRRPDPVTDSWEHMWWKELHHKRWKLERAGPLHSAV